MMDVTSLLYMHVTRFKAALSVSSGLYSESFSSHIKNTQMFVHGVSEKNLMQNTG